MEAESILVIITLKRELVLEGGNAPVFFAQDQEEQERVSFILSKILKGMIHDLENGVYLIVRH